MCCDRPDLHRPRVRGKLDQQARAGIGFSRHAPWRDLPVEKAAEVERALLNLGYALEPWLDPQKEAFRLANKRAERLSAREDREDRAKKLLSN